MKQPLIKSVSSFQSTSSISEVQHQYKNRKLYKSPPPEDSSQNLKKLITVIILCGLFIGGQLAGGIISHSISVLSDAFHLITDLVGFLVSFGALWFSKKQASNKMSFGYHRVELLGALFNLILIWVLAILLMYQATTRIINKEFVQEPKVMLIVACVGLPVNIMMFFILHDSKHHHGLTGHKHPPEQHTHKKKFQCTKTICQDVQCNVQNNHIQHCHFKKGEKIYIHRHKSRVKIIDGKVQKITQSTMTNQSLITSQTSLSLNDQEIMDKKQNFSKKKSLNEINDEQKMKPEKINRYHSLTQSQIKTQKKAYKDTHGHHAHHNNNHVHHHGHHHPHDHSHDHSHDHHHNHDEHDQEHQHQYRHGHHHHCHENMSMKAAIIHAISDVIQSIGLVISSLIIFFAGSNMGEKVTQWNDVHYCDPITTYIFCTLVFISTHPIAKNLYQIMMEATPEDICTTTLTEQFLQVEGVIDVHDLHVWDLRPGKTLLMGHVFCKQGKEISVLRKVTDVCRRHRIYHSTIQVQAYQYKNHKDYILCQHDIH